MRSGKAATTTRPAILVGDDDLDALDGARFSASADADGSPSNTKVLEALQDEMLHEAAHSANGEGGGDIIVACSARCVASMAYSRVKH